MGFRSKSCSRAGLAEDGTIGETLAVLQDVPHASGTGSCRYGCIVADPDIGHLSVPLSSARRDSNDGHFVMNNINIKKNNRRFTFNHSKVCIVAFKLDLTS